VRFDYLSSVFDFILIKYKGNTIFPLLEIRPVKFVDMTDISGIKIVKYAVHLT
jgi:hypothetical protein